MHSVVTCVMYVKPRITSLMFIPESWASCLFLSCCTNYLEKNIHECHVLFTTHSTFFSNHSMLRRPIHCTTHFYCRSLRLPNDAHSFHRPFLTYGQHPLPTTPSSSPYVPISLPTSTVSHRQNVCQSDLVHVHYQSTV